MALAALSGDETTVYLNYAPISTQNKVTDGHSFQNLNAKVKAIWLKLKEPHMKKEPGFNDQNYYLCSMQ